MCRGAGEDVLIGKTSPLPEEAPGMAQRWTKKDVSTSLRNSESGIVDSVMLTTNDAGARFVKVRVRGADVAMCCSWFLCVILCPGSCLVAHFPALVTQAGLAKGVVAAYQLQKMEGPVTPLLRTGPSAYPQPAWAWHTITLQMIQYLIDRRTVSRPLSPLDPRKGPRLPVLHCMLGPPSAVVRYSIRIHPLPGLSLSRLPNAVSSGCV